MTLRQFSSLLILMAVYILPAWSSQTQEGKLAQLYQDILTRDDNGTLPKLEDITPTLGKVEGMDASEIKGALPWVERALNSDNLEVQKYGELGLWAVARRADSASLLADLTPLLIRKMHHPDLYIDRGAFMVLSSMRPAPPESVIDEFIHDLQSDSDLNPAIVFGLLTTDFNSKRQDIAQAIQGYLHRSTLTTQQRIETLNAIAVRGSKDDALLRAVTTNLSLQNEDVKISAMRALKRSGEKGMAVGREQIEQIAASPTASERLRKEAHEALQTDLQNHPN